MIYVNKKQIIGKIETNIYTCKLNNEEMNRQIIEQIDIQGDRQKYKTNVQAQMTDWNMINKPGFNLLVKKILEVAKEISYSINKLNLEYKIIDIWGMKYKSNDFTFEHNHWPAVWSCVYYINPSENASQLHFPHFDYSVKPENGLLLFFDGWIKHEVLKKDFDDNRYVVSANLFNKLKGD